MQRSRNLSENMPQAKYAKFVVATQLSTTEYQLPKKVKFSMCSNIATLIASFTPTSDLGKLRLLSREINEVVCKVLRVRLLLILEKIVPELEESWDVAAEHLPDYDPSEESDSEDESELLLDTPEPYPTYIYDKLEEYMSIMQDYLQIMKDDITNIQFPQVLHSLTQMRSEIRRQYYDFEYETFN